jgi:hypothetical protein
MIKDTGLEVLALDKVSHANAQSSSYKLTIFKDEENKAKAPTSWPEFVECRRFRQRRQQRLPSTSDKHHHYDDWSHDDMSIWDSPVVNNNQHNV